MKTLRYYIEALVLILFYGACDLLPAPMASRLGGWIGRTVGPRLAATRKARKNLEESFPDLTTAEADQILAGMWDNLGRVMAEYPHLEDIGRKHVTLEGTEHIRAAQDNNQPIILFGAHLGNWEVMAPAVLQQLALSPGLVYRAPNNPVSDRLLDYARSLQGKLTTLPKSKTGTRHLVQTLKNGDSIGILIDQKYNEGIAVEFFGRPAMTSPAIAQLGRKFNAAVIPFRCERIEDCNFKITFEEPLAVTQNDTETIREAHKRLESWISDNPGQWLWLHRRWGKVES